MRKLFGYLAVICLLAAGCAPQLAGPPALIPRERLFGNPEKKDPQISPDGKFLTYLAPDKNNVLQIWLRSLHGGDDRQITREQKRGIQHYTWLFDNEHLVFARETDGDENWQLIAANIGTTAERNLTPYKGVRSLLFALEPQQPRILLIAMNLRDRRLYDIYRIDLDTGETRMVHRNGGQQLWWVADSRLRVNIATTRASVITRERPGRPWQTLRRWQPAEFGAFYGLSRDDQTLFMRGALDGDIGALLALDLQTGKETILAADPKYDLQDVFIHPTSREIQAVGFYRDKLEWQLLDASLAADFAALAKVDSGELNLLHPPLESPIIYSRMLGRRDLADTTWIVSFESDTRPTHHYAYDRVTKKATFLFSEQPQLDEAPLVSMQPVTFSARDGLELHGYLTLPANSEGKNLPTVIYVHGGPWLRDRWGFYNTIQWLANRGYTVLQVNYRGSTGYGRKFVYASYKEWGSKMHDDLIDGVKWLIEQGIADPRRVAIMGGSYGGYAALVGLTLTPNVFAAAVSSVGISDLIYHYNNYPPYWSLAKPLFRARVGDPEKEADMLKSRSPLFFADNAKAPALIAHGTNDARVVAAQSEQMVAALRQANKSVEYFIFPDEGHRQWRPENKFQYYAIVEEFLAKHLGGRFEPRGEMTGNSGVAK